MAIRAGGRLRSSSDHTSRLNDQNDTCWSKFMEHPVTGSFSVAGMDRIVTLPLSIEHELGGIMINSA